MSERKQLVESATKFLQLPQVQNKSLHQKLEFLNSKGLSKLEIEEALRHAEIQGPPVATPVNHRSVASNVSSETETPESEAWDSAQFLSAENEAQQPEVEAKEKSRLEAWRNVIPFHKPERKHWKSYLTMTVGALGSVYGMYELVKSFSGRTDENSKSSGIKGEGTALNPKEPAGLQLNRTPLNPATKNTSAEQLADVASQTTTLKEYVEALSASVKTLQLQESVRDQEFKSLSRQLDELQHSIPQMLESQKSAQYAMVAGLHDDLKALKGLLIRRNTPASSPQINAAQTPPQPQPNPFVSSPLATKSN
ncbi:hypothetical protein K493DRAFT_307068 [Basidiobolus meristosporus CBS 931.73]|uniref:Peroxisomal membrane protein PEX14 n=1 Tax=Basidiobolus meristosporus CBS 931.73 TaxID=1314790 RepID=A0A1Y1XLV1_9FUNG|nr:hypothetical protein K493DRAFT_307068 [Basidiobolus meristosporus CBS 931.73]|eukprot:ORX86486.1 hypothetical protein K493DRAFT_307068 [Basidiobolus meristosporus CBS 931.73]